jgi:SAM-dependent methyltransferase
MSGTRARYFMEDSREAERLAAKVDPYAWVQRYLPEPLAPGSRVLDVGCGPGAITAELARRFPGAEITGVDISDARLAAARKHCAGLTNADVRLGDAADLPFPAKSFDLVYCRFLLEYLAAPQDVVREIVRVCRPGGRVLLQDLDGQLLWHHPIDPALHENLERVLRMLARTGFDPFAGRKLFAWARAAGLHDIDVRAESYHLIAGRPTERDLGLWERKLDIALPVLEEALGSLTAACTLRDRFLSYLCDEDTLSYSVVFTVSGRAPGA